MKIILFHIWPRH